MVEHDHYREICAAASIGQATPEELIEFEQHSESCEVCRDVYFEYLNMAAAQFARANAEPKLLPSAARESLNSDLYVRRFVERAEREGIQFSEQVGEDVRHLVPPARDLPSKHSWQIPLRAIAAAVLVATMVSAGYYGRGVVERRSQTRGVPGTSVASAAPVSTNQLDELTAANRSLEEQITGLTTELGRTQSELSRTKTELGVAGQDQKTLESDRGALQARLEKAEVDLVESQRLAASAEQETGHLRDKGSESDALVAVDQARIHELTDELADKSALLDQERQLLALGHDVTDLMGARNLHIVDVVDTDPRGKTRPAFGRIFFTEGKSLVFYAYDLSDSKIEKANYQYRVWAKQEGSDPQLRNLGIFYSDDKSQRRWVFKCNDPKILNEIDSVFVTLEPSGGDSSHPQGQNLMYAYLRGQPNHP